MSLVGLEGVSCSDLLQIRAIFGGLPCRTFADRASSANAESNLMV